MTKNNESPIMAWSKDGVIYPLDAVKVDASEGFLPIRLSDMEGYRIYVRTLIFLFTVCAKRFAGPNRHIVILHSISGSLYTEVRLNGEPIVISPVDIEKIETMMRELVAKNEPIRRFTQKAPEVERDFTAKGRKDLSALAHYQVEGTMPFYEMCGEEDYFNGILLPSAGMVPWFDLIPYKDGIVIRTPKRIEGHELRRYVPQPHLFASFTQTREWGSVAGVDNVGDLNNETANGRINELIDVAEALQAKHIAGIALRIAASGKEDDIGGTRKRLVLIAGPSSSGKTTFAQKLGIQLRAEGLRPHLISMDNYFRPRRELPYEEDGKQDFESINAVDLELFGAHMKQLLKGQEVPLPTYNFLTGKREFNGETLQLGVKDILIVEGIHCLNETLSSAVAPDQKFKIYISAITTLNLDDHNRIPTTDCRLLRRIVRDYQHRGYSAAMTINRWESVRKGEEKNIFPYQEEADIFYNSAHIYELAVLKNFAEPLLYNVRPDQPEYMEARRLLRTLDHIIGVSSEHVPETSLIREFIGGGIYHQ